MLCLVLALVRVPSGRYPLAFALAALGVLNLVIGLRQPAPEPPAQGQETDVTWSQLALGGLIFVISTGLTLLLFGSVAAALLMGTMFTAPLVVIGAARKRRGPTTRE